MYEENEGEQRMEDLQPRPQVPRRGLSHLLEAQQALKRNAVP
jgi:hypothetical protein